MGVRRVVTGHDESGKSVFASDETVEPDRPNLLPSSEFFQLWGGDTTPQFPADGSMPKWRSYFPPIGGFRFGMLTIPPEIGAAEQDFTNVEDAIADVEAKPPGLLRYMDPSDPGTGGRIPATSRPGWPCSSAGPAIPPCPRVTDKPQAYPPCSASHA
jgi:hypothetical protein